MDGQGEGESHTLKTETVKYGEAATAPANPTREGYTFDGWDKAFDNITADTVVTALWKENTPPTPPTPTYTITYTDGVDGAAFSNDVHTAQAGDPTPAFSGGTPKYEKHVFKGWDPDPDKTPKVTGDATYTATWGPDENENNIDDRDEYRTITYTDGANGEAFEDVVFNNQLDGMPTPQFPGTPTRDGYKFKGWSPKVSATINGDATYVAQWKKVDDDDDDDDDTPTPTPTPTPPAPARPAGPAGPAPGGPGVVPAAPAVDGTPIADDAVPQAEPEAEPEADIPDDATPLAEGTWAVLNLIAAILTTLGAVVALFRKKEEEDEDEEDQNMPKTDEEEDEDDNRGKKMLAAKIAGAVAGVAAPITFFLTEDMSLPMAMIDKWTLLMVVFLAAQIVTAVLNKKASELDDEKEEEAEPAN